LAQSRRSPSYRYTFKYTNDHHSIHLSRTSPCISRIEYPIHEEMRCHDAMLTACCMFIHHTSKTTTRSMQNYKLRQNSTLWTYWYNAFSLIQKQQARKNKTCRGYRDIANACSECCAKICQNRCCVMSLLLSFTLSLLFTPRSTSTASSRQVLSLAWV